MLADRLQAFSIQEEAVKQATAKTKDNGTFVVHSRRPPSTAITEDLERITVEELADQPHHHDKIIYLNIQHSTKRAYGVVYTVRDIKGAQAQLWPLVATSCGQEILKDTVIAVKEPSYVPGPDGKAMICVHHPWDLLHIPKADHLVKQLFPAAAAESDVTALEAGNAALCTGNFVEATQSYNHAVQECKINGGGELGNVLLKRAFTLSRMRLHKAALTDAVSVLQHDVNNEKALKLAQSSATNLASSAKHFSTPNCSPRSTEAPSTPKSC